jgi:hypothetical protein
MLNALCWLVGWSAQYPDPALGLPRVRQHSGFVLVAILKKQQFKNLVKPELSNIMAA